MEGGRRASLAFAFAFALALALAGLLAACSGGGADRRPDEPDPPSAEEAIASFDEASLAASISAVNAAVEADPAEARRAALGALEEADGAARFGAVYALTLAASTEDPSSVDALRDLLASSDVTERLLAAGTLASLGEKEGVVALIEALASDEPLRNLDPPMMAWRYARANLLSMVDQDLGLRGVTDVGAAAEAQAAWEAWWEENATALSWDPELRRYVLG